MKDLEELQQKVNSSVRMEDFINLQKEVSECVSASDLDMIQ